MHTFIEKGQLLKIEDSRVVSEGLVHGWVDIPKVASISFITEK